MKRLTPLLVILSQLLIACQADSDASDNQTHIGQGLPASQQMQSAPSAGVKFNQIAPFTPIGEDNDKAP